EVITAGALSVVSFPGHNDHFHLALVAPERVDADALANYQSAPSAPTTQNGPMTSASSGDGTIGVSTGTSFVSWAFGLLVDEGVQNGAVSAGEVKGTIAVADLPAGQLAQTVGKSVTFDVDAAGLGWFVDPTPFDNREFEATTQPQVFLSKPGSDAAYRI